MVPFETYAEILKQGNLVAFPTETVYGLGASAWNPGAIQKIFQTKGRPVDNPLIVHISTVNMVHDFAAQVPAQAKNLMQKFWPGPLTLVFKRKPAVLDSITAGLDTVALRMPEHPDALKLISLAGPLVAPSANKSGRPSPTKAEHVTADFGNSIPILNGGDCEIGLESTVLDVTTHPAQILRPGFITAAAIREKCGINVVNADHTGSKVETPKSPGMKYSHYSPKANVFWLDDDETNDPETLYLLHDRKMAPQKGSIAVHFKRDYERLARELYDWFRRADFEGKKSIGIERFSEEVKTVNELTIALSNRIDKAAGLR